MNTLLRIAIISLTAVSARFSAQAQERAVTGKAAKASYVPAPNQKPPGFLKNKGQITDQNGQPNDAVKYLFTAPGMNVQLRASGFSYDTYVMRQGKDSAKPQIDYHRVDVSLEGSNPAPLLLAEQPLDVITNYYSSQARHTGVRSYSKVTYQDIYPGIDLVFMAKPGAGKAVEYNFIVHPGANAAQIKLRYSGAYSTALEDGKITLSIAGGQLAESIPLSYLDKENHPLEVAYQRADSSGNLYTFKVPAYDAEKTLIIDPTPDLVWGTYIGSLSTLTRDWVYGVATDAGGNIFATGGTLSAVNIATGGAYQSSIAGGEDAFIQRYNTAGNLIWSTYLGGAGDEEGSDIATDASGNVFVTGFTGSAGLSTAGAFRTALNGGSTDAFISKFSGGGALVWFTYYGTPSYNESFTAVATDGAGNVYAAGYTDGANGSNDIASAGAFKTTVDATDQMLVKFTNAGARVWGTYYGGTGNEGFVTDVAVDPAGNAYLGGTTFSTNGIGTPGAFQPTGPGGAKNAYLAKFNAAGARQWGTYYSNGFPNGSVQGGYVAVDPQNANNVYYLLGTSLTGLATAGTHQPTLNGSADNLLARFDAGGARIWATYSGGLLDEHAAAVAVDAKGNPYVFGSTLSSNRIATPGSYQTAIANPSAEDAYLQKFNSSGTLIWGTYYGGASQEVPTCLAIDPNCHAFVGGYTYSATGLSFNGNQNGSIAGASTGNSDGFVGMISQGYVPPGWAVTASTITANQTQTVCIGGFGVFIMGSDVYFTAPVGFSKPIYYQWQYSTSPSGPWTDLPGETFRDILPLVGSQTYYYRRQAKAFINCDTMTIGTTPVATVTVNSFLAPTANTGGGAFFDCPGTAMTLGGAPSATGGTPAYTYAWYTAVFPNLVTPFSIAPNPVVAPVANTIYTLKVTDANGCVDYDQMAVTIVQANAGPNVSFCTNSSGVQIGTPAIPGNAYSWTPATGLSCSNCAQPIATPAVTTTYTLTITTPVKGGGNCTTSSSATVTPVGPPNNNPNFAGPDKTICRSAGGSNTPLGTATAPGFTYLWNPGNYLDNTLAAQPNFSTGAGVQAVNCPMNYIATATNAGCTFYDQVSVTMINEFLDVPGPLCGPRWVGQAAPITCPGTTYAWTTNDPFGTILSGATSASAYLKDNSPTNVAGFTRTSTLNGVSCPALAYVSPTCGGNCGLLIQVLAQQACPKVFPGMPLTLNAGGVNPAQYTFLWSDNLSGSPSAYVDNPFAPTVNVLTNLSITLTVTITDVLDPSHTCTASIAVNNPAYSLPVFNTPNLGACPNTNVSIGLAPVAGYSYQWTANPTLSCTTCSNPTANTPNSQTYYAVITSSPVNGSCQITDSVNLTISNVTVNAGPDRQVCNGGAVTLGTPDPSFGAWSYSWSPPTMSGPYINGTTSLQPQPQVLFSGVTPVTYILTVTDPATGCVVKDTVVLSSTALTQGDAGPDKTTCPGVAVQIGQPAIPGVTYSWSPALGLSCSNCAQPTVTNPTATQVYTVTVTYPAAPGYAACNISDAMTVNVLPVAPISFSNKVYCPGGAGVVIGGTVLNAQSYAWSPATGLSCINCASPTANPPAATTYTLTVTFINGCTGTGTVSVTPTNPVNAGSNQTLCPGGPGVVIGQPAVGGVTYSWSPVTGLSCTTCAQPTATPTSTTTYTLNANNGSCNAISTVTVTVLTLPTLAVSGTQNICSGACAAFSVTSATAGLNFSWSPVTGVASPSSSSTLICPTATTVYTVTQTQVATGCSSSLAVPVTVSPNAAPVLMSSNATICAGSSTTLALSVSPPGAYTYSWLPVAYLSNPFIQNPVAYPPATTSYTVTVTNNATGCSNNATVNVVVTPINSCTTVDYGDAPSSYNGAGGAFPPNAIISPNIRIGANIDGELAGYVASPGALPSGDDLGGTGDEDGVSGFSMVTNSDNSYAVSVPSLYNNTGSPATVVAWIDWNGDGDFLDPGERSSVVSIPSSASTQSAVLTWLNYNLANQVVAGHTYMRLRFSTDNTSGWLTNPQPISGTSDGEVEDYDLTILGEDWGDAQGYPTARATVNPDANNDGLPDAAGSLWLGPKVDYAEYTDPATLNAMGDDLNGIDDEDGLTIGGPITAGVPVNFNVVSNAVGTAAGRVAMWIDWNGDGDFTDATDQFYSAFAVHSGTPVTTVFSVTPPVGFSATKYMVRIGIKPATASAFTQASTFIATVQNGEFEDYIAPAQPLPVTITAFDAKKEGSSKAALHWNVVNNDLISGFTVDRSADGSKWTVLGTVPSTGSKAGSGYVYKDERPLTGTNHYRLTIQKPDGSISYSAVRTLLFDGTSDKYLITGGEGNILFRNLGNEPVWCTVIAANGKMIARAQMVPAANTMNFVAASGLYLLRMTDESGNILAVAKAVVR